jgi:hypothetical protein
MSFVMITSVDAILYQIWAHTTKVFAIEGLNGTANANKSAGSAYISLYFYVQLVLWRS